MAPDVGIGVIVAASASEQGSLEYLQTICNFLAQHQVPTVLLVQCATAIEAAATSKALQPHCASRAVHLSIIQPLNLLPCFSAALSLLNIPAVNIAFINLAHATDVNAAASAAGCSVLHLPSKFDTVLSHIVSTIKNTTGALCCGYIMKPQRQVALMAQGILPFQPKDGIFFVPVDLDSTSTELMRNLDILLHKSTDYLCSNSSSSGGGDVEEHLSGAVPSYQPEFAALLEQLDPKTCVVDPLPALEVVIDRVKMATALDAACKAARKFALPVRTPAWHLVTEFRPEVLKQARAAAGVSLPCVIKPQVACGLHESHQMAFIWHPSGLQSDLDVPLPALLQEYVDHNSTLWKIYVAGNQVFTAQKKSTPNLRPLKELLADGEVTAGEYYGEESLQNFTEKRAEENGGKGRQHGAEEGEGGDARWDSIDLADFPPSVEFNSLESLPVSLPWLRQIDPGGEEETQGEAAWAAMMRPEFLAKLAHVLRQQLELTLFGFDVVFDFEAGEAVLLDLNFFPSFKGIEEAPQALRAALLERWKSAGRARGTNVK